jgi:hypothetical protein
MLAEPIHVRLLSNILQILPLPAAKTRSMSPHNMISPSMLVAPPPSIAVTLAINPPNFTLGSHVELSVTAVSNAFYPITIDTWWKILNPRLSQERGSLVGVDKDTLKELPLHMIDV